MNHDQLQQILAEHKLWLNDDGGSRANLRGANLRGADLSGANLRDADLRGANLSGADLSGANLRDADLRGANLSGADLRGAALCGADLRDAALRGANLSGADLSDVYVNEKTSFYSIACPEEGSFIAWKKCQHDVIVKLRICEEAKRSSATTLKCRASKVEVLEVEGAEIGVSKHDNLFTYKKGDIIEVKDFNEDRWQECSTGIHFFMNKEQAKQYN